MRNKLVVCWLIAVLAMLNFLMAPVAKAELIYICGPLGDTIDTLDYSTGVTSFFAGNLSSPYALASDSAGNLFVTNESGNGILKFSPTGVALDTFTVTGEHSIAIDKYDNVYVACNTEIHKFSPMGADLGTFARGLSAYDIAFDKNGNLYAATFDNTIRRFSASGEDLGVFASIGLAPIALDNNGNLYVGSYGAVTKFGPDGTNLGKLSSPNLGSPIEMACDAGGYLYVSGWGVDSGRGISRFGPDGTYLGLYFCGGPLTGIAFQTTPEPATLLLLGLGAVVLRKRKA